MASAPPPPPDGSAKGQEATAPPIMQQVSKFEIYVGNQLQFYSFWSSGSKYRTYFLFFLLWFQISSLLSFKNAPFR